MIDEHTITNKRISVTLFPYELGNIREFIRTKIDKCTPKCTEDDGYVLKSGNIKIHSNTISNRTSNCIFDVSYEMESLKPKVGNRYRCMINLIYEQGIFTLCCSTINVLVPAATLDGWTWTGRTFTHLEHTLRISKGTWIIVELTNICYDNHEYKCIGTLVI